MSKETIKALSDEDLVLRIRTTDSDAFSYLIERYQQKLFLYVLKYIKDQDIAEDIVQESFITIYKNLNNFDCKRIFSAWAYRITHNQTIDIIRKSKKEVALSNDDWLMDVADDRPALEDELDTKISRKEVRLAISKLPLKYRQIIILYYFQGEDYQSIATILNIPVSTVSTRLSRAKNKLKKMIRKEHSI